MSSRVVDFLKMHTVALVLCLASVIVLCALMFPLEGSIGGADSYQHFQTSKYAFVHPWLYLDHWGKPLFTLFSSPFSQFGFKAIQLFNILVMGFSGWLAYLVLKQLKCSTAASVILLVIFTPIYYQCAFSGLTEPLFGCVLLGALVLFLQEKYMWSAIVISFIPMARTEGIMMLPIFGGAMLLLKQYKHLPWLLTGTLLYSIVGSFYYLDFFWLITKSPYSEAIVYGKGSFWHYYEAREEWLGAVLVYGFYFGLLGVGWKLFKSKTWNVRFGLLMAAGIPVLYFLAHSYLWSKGSSGSLGLLRIMAGITPLLAIVAAIGLDAVLDFLKKWKWAPVTLAVLATSFVAGSTLSDDQLLPAGVDPEDRELKRAAKWFKNSKYADRKVCSYNPTLHFFFDRDPHDITKSMWAHKNPYAELFQGDLLVWDAHFGPNEGEMELEKLLHHDQLRLIKWMMPNELQETLGGHPYEIVFFEKDSTYKRIYEAESIYNENFEVPDNPSLSQYLYDYDGDSLNTYGRMKENEEFIEILNIKLGDRMKSQFAWIHIEFNIRLEDPEQHENLLLVASAEEGGKAYRYKKTKMTAFEPWVWHTYTYDFLVTPPKSIDSNFKLFLWNTSGQRLAMDEIHVFLTHPNQ
jgi:hypothetical protein